MSFASVPDSLPVMSGVVLIALAVLSPQYIPHPSTAAAYQAPVIRPFEPAPDFGREEVPADFPVDRHRRPLEAPVTVEAYFRSYEFTLTDFEKAYEQGVAAAELRADQSAGRLDGAWRIVDASGRAHYDVVLHDSGFGPAEGGWRNVSGWGPATSDGVTLMLNGAGVMTLERTGLGWRGLLTVDGQTGPARLIRLD